MSRIDDYHACWRDAFTATCEIVKDSSLTDDQRARALADIREGLKVAHARAKSEARLFLEGPFLVGEADQ